jgi:hypothetical protein
MPERMRPMPYRKVSAAEQCWYIIKFVIKEKFKKLKSLRCKRETDGGKERR